jgi:hypothetical protein
MSVLLPLWEKVASKRPDEGARRPVRLCASKAPGWTSLDPWSAGSADTFSHKGRRRIL